MHIANKNKELATLRDVCNFIQLHTEEEWRGCQFLHDLLQNVKRNINYSRMFRIVFWDVLPYKIIV
jgi:hypothetical protein